MFVVDEYAFLFFILEVKLAFQPKKRRKFCLSARVIFTGGHYSSMDDYESANKNPNKTSDEEGFHGYVPRKCDLKCYKCRFQGICVIPRRIIDARKQFISNNFSRSVLHKNGYGLNGFLSILGYKKKLLRYLPDPKKKIYGKDEE